jgi:YtkA-like protein
MLVTGCSRLSESSAGTADTVTIQHEISPQPARVGATTVVLRLFDATRKPVVGAHIAMEADMTHAGMSPQFANAKETGPGSYDGQMQFPMAGDWVIFLHVMLPGGKKLEQQFDVKGVRPN